MTLLTSAKALLLVICLVPPIICLPPGSMIQRYPHQDFSSPVAHLFMAVLCFEFDRSHVLKAQGTNNSSAARLMAGSENIAPASLHPCHPLHSTKLAKMGLSVRDAMSMAV
uniref:Secreted protein n=1 Tax=Odontella aurita TaxID=265563 RepID=A0A7S4JX68_9STRA